MNRALLRYLLVAGLLAIFALGQFTPLASGQEPMEPVSPNEPGDVHLYRVSKSRDAGKNSPSHGAIGYGLLSMPAQSHGISPDTIRFEFDAPAQILGVMVSVDINAKQTLVEVSGAIGDDIGYGVNADADWLIHTSHASDGDRSGSIDEHVMFAPSVAPVVEAGEPVSFGAWIVNRRTARDGVVPEIIVYYRWLTEPAATT